MNRKTTIASLLAAGLVIALLRQQNEDLKKNLTVYMRNQLKPDIKSDIVRALGIELAEQTSEEQLLLSEELTSNLKVYFILDTLNE